MHIDFLSYNNLFLQIKTCLTIITVDMNDILAPQTCNKTFHKVSKPQAWRLNEVSPRRLQLSIYGTYPYNES